MSFIEDHQIVLVTVVLPIIVSILGSWIVGHVYYRKALRRKRLQWAITFVNRFQKSPGVLAEFEGRYRGRVVDALSVSDVIIINNGKDPIVPGDVAPNSPIRIVAKNGKRILNATLQPVMCSDDGSDIRLLPKDGEIVLDFDFIEVGEYAAFEVVHDGLSGEDLKLEGRIVGGTITRAQSEYRVPFAMMIVGMGSATLVFELALGIFYESRWLFPMITWTLIAMFFNLWVLRQAQPRFMRTTVPGRTNIEIR